MDCEFNPVLRDEILFMKEKIESLKDIIEAQGALLRAYEEYNNQLHDEINDLLGNP